MELKTMEDLFSSFTLHVFLYLSLFHQSSYSQQAYINNQTLFNCSDNASTSKGYLCDIGHVKSCMSFVFFRSRTPYDTALTIGQLLGSEASEIASLNNISSSADKIPANKSILVPVSCTCSGNIYQHYAPYTVKKSDTYYRTATETYQGLTTCQAMISQNYYDPEEIPVGAELTVPVRCACPTENQTNSGVASLLTYTPDQDDVGVTSIGKRFGVDGQSILEANMLSPNSSIFASTPILVPLKRESCSVYPELFFCKCTKGYLADGNCRSSNKSFPTKLVMVLGVGIGIVFLCLFLSGYKLYKWIKERRIRIRKEEFFKQNGGFLLQEKLASIGNNERAKLFTAEELQRATDNYNQSRFIGQGGCGTVYKGMLTDGTIVAVKRSRAIDRKQIEQFINEVVILSQINHRNIVKLLGFCLETEAPLLVYEFISNGTLSHHIRKQEPESSLSWENRLRIACDVAGALTYMHSAASIPIFHRDIKSSNILLDDKYNAKVSDFGTSRLVPDDKTHLTTAVQGTFGYMDPEYFQSSQFTDKSDVYSFGVTLTEILTGETPYSYAKDKGNNLVATFISFTKENQLFQILDPQVARDAGKEDLQVIAELVMNCLRLNGKKRPTMKQVSVELEGLYKTQSSLQIEQEPELLRDKKVPDMYATFHTSEEPIEQSISSSLEMESVSF
ncbi:wall-associated receptor kinase-like 1 [Ziziphus jujuba]|uniref:Wall-associated receptor kinase-like 1 n=1 Tax=Ziziphus jujuba TaxID=326968 RepID=A0A6P3ZB55_ZIZJJ|nr:wall-associated receptor kinase-like 1 [Ziziphus jujuba]